MRPYEFTILAAEIAERLTMGKSHVQELNFLQGDVIRPEEKDAIRDGWHRMALTGLALAEPDPAVQVFMDHLGVPAAETQKRWKIIQKTALGSSEKSRLVLAAHPTQAYHLLFAIDGPQRLLERSSYVLNARREIVPLTARRRFFLVQAFQVMAARGWRLLAIALRRDLFQSPLRERTVHRLTFLGVVALADQVQPDAAAAMRAFAEAGVEVNIVTREHAGTAVAAARNVGLTVPVDSVVSGELFRELSDAEVRERLPTTTVWADLEPLDKQRLIRLFEAQGQVVRF